MYNTQNLKQTRKPAHTSIRGTTGYAEVERLSKD